MKHLSRRSLGLNTFTFALTPLLFVTLSPVLAGVKIKGVKPKANPPEYARFSKLLPGDDRIHHALDRLTFGPRPGDFEAVRQTGLERWVELELNPGRVPDNPVLEQRLAPFESLRMSTREIALHYPSPQMIAAVARGRDPLPQDPELRAIVMQLADRYLRKREADAKAGGAVLASGSPLEKTSDDTDLDPKIRIADILGPNEIRVLQNGTPDQKTQVLKSIPPEKHLDFVWALRPQQRRQLFNFAPVALRRQLMLTVSPQNVVADDLIEGKLLRAIYSNHQLQELLVDFWFNHFNVFLNKGGERYLVPAYERDAVRPYVFGRFYDLLLATAKSPGMLFYLDNWQSVAPQSQRANQKRKRGLNENYGRELLELHTLGVDGGYTQQDVIEVARCFTGWTIANPGKGGGFEYNDKVHDKEQKIVLGHVIPAGGGMSDGLMVLDILAHHPSTAHFISLQLARRFVADNPPPSLVNRMAQTFTRRDGDLREVMRTMLSSGEFWSEGAYRAKVKMPFEMVVSAVRATNADVQSAYPLANEIQKLGEPLYRKTEPTGYSSANAEWISSAGLLERMNFALALAHDSLRGLEVNVPEGEGLAIGSPEFQRH